MKMIYLLLAVVTPLFSACEKKQAITEKGQAITEKGQAIMEKEQARKYTVDSSTFSAPTKNEEDIDFEQEWERACDFLSNYKRKCMGLAVRKKPNKEYRWIVCVFEDEPKEVFYFVNKAQADGFRARLDQIDRKINACKHCGK